jgi:hypothetical protein
MNVNKKLQSPKQNVLNFVMEMKCVDSEAGEKFSCVQLSFLIKRQLKGLYE